MPALVETGEAERAEWRLMFHDLVSGQLQLSQARQLHMSHILMYSYRVLILYNAALIAAQQGQNQILLVGQ